MDNLALWGSFLSGLGALTALIISIVQLKRNSKYSEANFWLTLREMFKVEDRDSVHKDLRKGKWIKTIPSDKSEMTKIEDYFGMFEICEGMLEKKVISEKVFKNLYEYRIYNILCNKKLVHKKLIYEYYDWRLFYKLLERLYGKKWNEFYVFLSQIKIKYNEVDTEEKFLKKLNDKKKAKYLNFKKTLNVELE